MATEAETETGTRRVHITGDGSVRGTDITDVDTGERIPRVKSVEFSHEAGEMPRAKLVTILASVDVVVDATVEEQCPYCGEKRPWEPGPHKATALEDESERYA